MKEEEIRKKLLKYRTLQSSLSVLTKRRDLLLSKLMEIETTIETLKGIKGEGRGIDGLLAIGPGVYIPGSISKGRKLIIEIGADIAVEKELEDAKDMMEKRKKTLEDGLISIKQDMYNLNNQLIEIEPEIRSILSILQAG